MKKIIFLILIVLCSFKINAQTTIVSWNCDNSVAPNYVNPTYLSYASDIITAAGINYLGLALGCDITNNPNDRQAVFNNFPAQPIYFDPNAYVFVFYVASSNFDLSRLKVATKRNESGSTNWDVRIKPFLVSLYSNATFSTNCVYHDIGLTMSVSAGDTLEFRFYAGGGSDIIQGNWRIDSLFFETNTSPLPVELLAFRANVVDHRVDLNWITASEKNNDYFKVERSKDLQSWEYVGEIPGAGTSSFQNEYTLTDDSPFDGTSYYRLLQYDFDGKETIFKPIEVKVSDEKTMSIIYDVLGQVVSDWSLEHPKLKPNVTYIKLYEDGKREKYVSR